MNTRLRRGQMIVRPKTSKIGLHPTIVEINRDLRHFDEGMITPDELKDRILQRLSLARRNGFDRITRQAIMERVTEEIRARIGKGGIRDVDPGEIRRCILPED